MTSSELVAPDGARGSRLSEGAAATGSMPALDDTLAWGLIEAAPDGLILADESGEILLVNQQAQDIFRYDRAELIGRSIEELLPERFRSVHRAHRTRYRAAPTVRAMGAGLVLYGRRADGSEFPVEISLSPLQTDDGLRIVAAVRDITERVAAEARARDVNQIVDATRDAVSISDAKTLQFTYVNRGLVEQVGYSSDELLGMTMLDVAPEFTEDQLRALLAGLELEDSSSQIFVTTHRRRDGTDIPVEIVLQVITGDDGRPRSYVQIARDISERLAVEARQHTIQQELRTLEDRERMARDLHDLVIQRLFATGMIAQGLQSRLVEPSLASRAADIVTELDTTIREIRTVIFDLHAPVAGSDGGFRRAILAVVDEQRPSLGFAPHLQFDGPVDHTPDRVAQQVIAILREALANVCRHAGASRVEITIEASDDLVVRVTDNGVGLPSDAAGKNGNGLRNMAARAQELGGSFEVLTRSEGGTTLECRIPVRV